MVLPAATDLALQVLVYIMLEQIHFIILNFADFPMGEK